MAKRSPSYWLLSFQKRFGRWWLLWWLLVSAPLWLLATFVALHEGYTHLRVLHFLPSLRWYWHWYVIFALLYLIGVFLFVIPAANRTTLERAKERSDEKARRYGVKVLKAAKPIPAQVVEVAADPNIIPRVEDVEVHRDRDGNIIEGAGGNKSRAIVLRCKNEREIKPPRRVGGISNVSAQISYTGYGKGATRLPAEGAAWLSEPRDKVDFPVDATHRLVVAVIDNKNGKLRLTGVQKRGAALAKKVKEPRLEREAFRVRVTWYADSERDSIADYDYMLDLNAFESGEPHLITRRLWRGYRVNGFIVEGYKYLAKGREGGYVTDLDRMDSEMLELQRSIANWESKVSGFLGVHYDAETKSRFLGSTVIRDGENTGTIQERLRSLVPPMNAYTKLDRQPKGARWA